MLKKITEVLKMQVFSFEILSYSFIPYQGLNIQVFFTPESVWKIDMFNYCFPYLRVCKEPFFKSVSFRKVTTYIAFIEFYIFKRKNYYNFIKGQ